MVDYEEYSDVILTTQQVSTKVVQDKISILLQVGEVIQVKNKFINDMRQYFGNLLWHNVPAVKMQLRYNS